MSVHNKFFDEVTDTSYVSGTFIITRLQNLPDLDSELHVTSNTTRQAGTFRTVWIAAAGETGGYDAGMEMLDVEGNLWGRDLEKQGTLADSNPPEASLQCKHCKTVVTGPVPEAHAEFIRGGFTVARHCERCKGTSPWTMTPASTEQERERVRVPGGPDDRRKGRVAIKMRIKVFCDRLGSLGEDICETINVSANGLYFGSNSPYKVGETLRIVAPFEEGTLSIPVPARVVRLDRPPESSVTAVAVELNPRGAANRAPSPA